MNRTHINPNEKYGMLTTVRNTGKKDSCGYDFWLCRCDCGNYVERTSRYLKRKELKTHSCGCQAGAANTKHGDKRTNGKYARLYSIWSGMRWRCNAKNHDKHSYARNGIKIYDGWANYQTFKSWALENGYSDGLTIDRIDYNGNYEPDNCRWVTIIEQANNKSSNHNITYHGKTKTLAEWSRELGINYSTLRSRINRQGLDLDKAFSTNKGKRDAITGRFIGGYDVQKAR